MQLTRHRQRSRCSDGVVTGLTDASALAAEARAGHKQAAAERAVAWIDSGMVVGLGSGSTAVFAIRRIGMLVQAGTLRDLLGVPTSAASEAEARRHRNPIAEPGWQGAIDVTIDGADEVDPALDLIKGGGGALLHEKVVAQASRRLIVVADDSKLSTRLGMRCGVPVEVIPFGWRSQARFIESLGARVDLRSRPDGTPFTTDEGNFVLDCAFGPLAEASRIDAALAGRAGIVENGIFLGLATDLIVAGVAGVRHQSRA